MLNGAANRRWRPSIKTSVLHSNTSYTLALYSNATNQTINYIHNIDGVIKEKNKMKRKRCKVYGVWCMTGVNCAVTGHALGGI